jgi:hypothetical protein
MKFRTIWSEPMGALLASVSPGSALTYQLGAADLGFPLPRRNMTTEGCPEAWPEDAEQLFKDAFFHRARALR